MKKPAALCAAATLAFAGAAFAEETTATDQVESAKAPAAEEESYPLSGSFGMSYRFNHANFADAEGDGVGFGTQLLSISAGASYSITDSLSVSAGMSATKEIATASYDRAGYTSNKIGAAELNDFDLSVDWGNFYKIPVVDIRFSGGVGLTLPASRASQAAGLVMAVGPSLSASWSKWGLTVSSGIAYSINAHEDASQKIDCEKAPQNCEISGADLGSPNQLHSLSGNFGLSYKIIDPLSVSFAYNISNGYGAVAFPKDEYTSEYAQIGDQAGTGAHGTSFSLSYRVLDPLSISVGMGTTKSLRSDDNKRITNPFFDTEDPYGHRATRYTLGLRYSI